MTDTHKIGLGILLSALLVGHSSFAASCYEPSPNYTLLGDKYYDLDSNKPLTADDKNAISSILKKLVGSWKGKGSTFECIGSEDNLVVKNKALTLTAKISTNASDELHIDIEKYHLDDKTKSNDYLFYFGDVNDYQSVLITANKIVIEEKFRQETINATPDKKRYKKRQQQAQPSYGVIHGLDGDDELVDYVMRQLSNSDLTIEERQQFRQEKKVASGKNRKRRQSFKPLYEMVHTLEYDERHFNYRLQRYINGSLAIEERWQLRRD